MVPLATVAPATFPLTMTSFAVVSLATLWLPVVLSGVIVFIASSIMHMVLTYHRSDYHQLPDEDKVLAGFRPSGLRRGLYVFPYCQPKDMKSPAIIEKYKQGPVGFLMIMPNGPPAMPKFLGQWFGFCLLVGIFVAYLTGHAVATGADYLAVFHVAGTAAFLAYGLGNLTNAIWRGQTWSTTIKEVIDGLIYGLLTAGTFGWLWPR
jgi:hypothetical protein